MRSTPFIQRLLPAPVDGGFRREDAWIWCGSVIRDDHGAFHMFASMWEKTVPFSPHWLTNSRVTHAVSPTPEGPYVYRGDVLPPRGSSWWDGRMTHNPTIHRYRDQYLLFYTGTTYPEPPPGPGDHVTNEMVSACRARQRIGLAVADSLDGPWRRPDHPCLETRPGHWDWFMTTNPAPCVLSDGRILLLYKSSSGAAAPLRYGVAMAGSCIMVGVGGVSLVAAGVALVAGQPSHVTYLLLLAAVIGIAVGGAVLREVRALRTQGELRRMDAADAGVS